MKLEFEVSYAYLCAPLLRPRVGVAKIFVPFLLRPSLKMPERIEFAIVFRFSYLLIPRMVDDKLHQVG